MGHQGHNLHSVPKQIYNFRKRTTPTQSLTRTLWRRQLKAGKMTKCPISCRGRLLTRLQSDQGSQNGCHRSQNRTCHKRRTCVPLEPRIHRVILIVIVFTIVQPAGTLFIYRRRVKAKGPHTSFDKLAYSPLRSIADASIQELSFG